MKKTLLLLSLLLTACGEQKPQAKKDNNPLIELKDKTETQAQNKLNEINKTQQQQLDNIDKN